MASSSAYVFIHTIQEFAGRLYIVGGGFDAVMSAAGMEPATGIVAWSGDTIDNLGGGPGLDLEAVIVTGDTLWAGGGTFGSGWVGTYQLPVISTSTTHPELTQWTLLSNPATDVLHIRKVPAHGLELRDATGRMLEIIREESTWVDVPAGIYFLQDPETGKASRVVFR